VKKPTKPRSAKADKAKWTIVQSLVEDIDTAFDNPGKIVNIIAGSHPTWNNIVSGEGVRRKTAENIVKGFFELVRLIQEGSRAPDGISERIAKDMFGKYKDLIKDHNYKQFLEQTTPH
jgi:hypothetical protein